jgi:hypothetical protein
MTFAAFRNLPGCAVCLSSLAACLLALAPVLPGDAPADEIPARQAGSAMLAALAGAADFVGLAQVRDTDYLRRRDIPVSGSAYLGVLIAYKAEQTADLIEVYEKGLRAYECYFPNPTVFEEGRRYLVFLRRDPGNAERFRGLPEGCALEVLVDRDNRYAVRMPVTGLRLTEAQQAALAERAHPTDFADPYAIIDDEALPPDQRDAMIEAGQIVPYAPDAPSRRWKYTRGIPLDQFRELLELEPDL